MPRSSDASPIMAKINTLTRLLDVSPSTVRRLVKQGVLPPPIRLVPGGEPAWLVSEVYAALDRAAGRSVRPVEEAAAA